MKTVKLKQLYLAIIICVLVLNNFIHVHAAQTISGIKRLEEGIDGYESGKYFNAVINLEAALKELPQKDK